MSIFAKKSISSLLEESNEKGKRSLKKTLGPVQLISLGIGAIIGAGLFSITGYASAEFAGPAITISFLVAAFGCCFAGLCYAEFASMIPVAGSAYTYSYSTMGEFIAWIIGWDLILEYAVAAATVSISWSRYLVRLLTEVGIDLPVQLVSCPFDGGIVNLPAAFIVVVMSMILIRGTEKSTILNTVIVIIKLAIVFVFIFVGWKYIHPDNYVPYIPKNTGTFGEYGISGIIRGAAIVFFAFIGFDAVSTAAQETKNPQKNMPIGILGSLLICTILYVLFSHVMTGVTSYLSFKGQDGIAPVSVAISHMGIVGSDGVFHAAYPWLNKAVSLAILFGYSSVILVMLLGQSRVFYSMSKDGLVAPLFSEIHEKFRTPYKSNLLFMVFVSLFALFIPARVAGEMTSIGTLLAFIIVCIGVLVMRKTMPNLPRSFKTPFVPYVPILGIIVCLFMMVFLPFDTWIRLLVWMIFGLDLYTFYGRRHSKLYLGKKADKKETFTVNVSVCAVSLILIVVSIWHQNLLGWDREKILAVVSILIGIVHGLIYAMRIFARPK